MTLEQNKYGGFVTDIVAQKLLDSLGITQEQVDKVKTIIDNIDIRTENGITIIQLKLSNK